METRFNQALNKEQTMYGLKVNGLIAGAIGGLIAIIKIGLMWFILGCVPGYIIGSIISGYLHTGRLQRLIYWRTPLKRLIGGKLLPASILRKFF